MFCDSFHVCWRTESHNGLGLEWTLKIIWLQPLCQEQGHFPLHQIAHSAIQPGLEHFQGWEGGWIETREFEVLYITGFQQACSMAVSCHQQAVSWHMFPWMGAPAARQ